MNQDMQDSENNSNRGQIGAYEDDKEFIKAEHRHLLIGERNGTLSAADVVERTIAAYRSSLTMNAHQPYIRALIAVLEGDRPGLKRQIELTLKPFVEGEAHKSDQKTPRKPSVRAISGKLQEDRIEQAELEKLADLQQTKFLTGTETRELLLSIVSRLKQGANIRPGELTFSREMGMARRSQGKKATG
jgi:hypothetical protein